MRISIRKIVVLSLLSVFAFSLQISAAESSQTQITVYNHNLGLVRQTRELTLHRGLNETAIEGVSAQIDPTSVRLSFPNAANNVEIREQNFHYDLVNSHKIFEKYIGEDIEYRTESGEQISGRLLSYDGAHLILRDRHNNIRIAASKSIVDYFFPSLPEGLILKPTLRWQLDAALNGSTQAELSYLTGGLSWHAEYVLLLSENEQDLSLASWVSLENRSGAAYQDAQLKLIAGDIHRAPRETPRAYEDEARVMATMAKGEPFDQREFFDYHLYELSRPVTLQNNEIKQVTLFDEKSCQGQKIYTFRNAVSRDSERPLAVEMHIANSRKNNLGIPLPAGVVRMFKRDIDQSMQLIGEDRIEHSSKNDTLQLTIGQAFDVRGKRIVKDRTAAHSRSEILSIEIQIRNRRSEAITVEVQENQRGDWFVKNASHLYEKRSNALLVFPLTIDKNSSEMIHYTFQRNW